MRIAAVIAALVGVVIVAAILISALSGGGEDRPYTIPGTLAAFQAAGIELGADYGNQQSAGAKFFSPLSARYTDPSASGYSFD